MCPVIVIYNYMSAYFCSAFWELLNCFVVRVDLIHRQNLKDGTTFWTFGSTVAYRGLRFCKVLWKSNWFDQRYFTKFHLYELPQACFFLSKFLNPRYCYGWHLYLAVLKNLTNYHVFLLILLLSVVIDLKINSNCGCWKECSAEIYALGEFESCIFTELAAFLACKYYCCQRWLQLISF